MRKRADNVTRFIFCTGGVVSSVGKGVTAASIARILKSRGVSVSIQKLDPYLNVDAGTMSPYQHGEVFVTEDGSETDLDLGHYERFIDQNLTSTSNVTTGQVYSAVIASERRGDYGADASHTQCGKHARQWAIFAALNCGQQIVCAFVSEAWQRQDVFTVQVVEVGKVMQQAMIHEELR